jgi:hypothetical protein
VLCCAVLSCAVLCCPVLCCAVRAYVVREFVRDDEHADAAAVAQGVHTPDPQKK